jgi:hypothetical protein
MALSRRVAGAVARQRVRLWRIIPITPITPIG